LRNSLRTRDVEQVKTALKRWVKVAIVWQVLVLGACGAYLVAFSPGNRASITWIAPAVGALFGTAIPLQFVVMAILRSMRA
jgi:VanZ family protein